MKENRRFVAKSFVFSRKKRNVDSSFRYYGVFGKGFSCSLFVAHPDNAGCLHHVCKCTDLMIISQKNSCP